MSKLQLITKGLIKENPTFVLILGMCPCTTYFSGPGSPQ